MTSKNSKARLKAKEERRSSYPLCLVCEYDHDYEEESIHQLYEKFQRGALHFEELDELEDEEDERILMEYRNQRLAEMKALQERSKYGEVKEITAPEYVKEVSEPSVIFHEFPD